MLITDLLPPAIAMTIVGLLANEYMTNVLNIMMIGQ